MANNKYRVHNWSEYNKSLEERGSIEIWFDPKAIKAWHPEKSGKKKKRGRPVKYSNAAIECALIIKYVYKLPFRQMEGLIRSLVKSFGLNLKTPDYSTVCKRQSTIDAELISKYKKSKKIYLAFDSSGLKVFGEGEWKTRQHGYSKRRTWVKIHVGLGLYKSGKMRIESVKLTDKNELDGKVLPKMLNKIDGEIGKILGDGAYGSASNYEEAAKRKAKLIVPPKKGAKINLEKAQTSIGWREKNESIRAVQKLGKELWKAKTKYHKRSLVENVFFRWKTIFGPKLDTRKFANQEMEALLKCKILNRINEIGMPDSYRVA